MLKIQNLTKTFHKKVILDNVSLSLEKGEIALLLGASGVGKSTLLRILNNLEAADSGAITQSEPLRIGMVFQHFNLFGHLSVERNITLALEKVVGLPASEAQEIAHELLEKFGLRDKAQLAVTRLSGGQKQRLAIARALALNPHVLCMDEPTSALDPGLTDSVAKHMQALAQEGYSLLVATHDMRLLDKLSCTLYLMDKGEIIETAHSSQFKENPERFPALYGFAHGSPLSNS